MLTLKPTEDAIRYHADMCGLSYVESQRHLYTVYLAELISSLPDDDPYKPLHEAILKVLL